MPIAHINDKAHDFNRGICRLQVNAIVRHKQGRGEANKQYCPLKAITSK